MGFPDNKPSSIGYPHDYGNPHMSEYFEAHLGSSDKISYKFGPLDDQFEMSFISSTYIPIGSMYGRLMPTLGVY